MRTFLIFTLHKILLRWCNQGRCEWPCSGDWKNEKCI